MATSGQPVRPSELASAISTAVTDALADWAQGCIARARRTTTSTTTTTTVGVLRLDNITLRQGRNYRITATAHFDGSVNNDIMRTEIRYTTGGVTSTAGSTVLPGSGADGIQPNATFGETRIAMTDYTPANDETMSMMLCIARVTGSGNVTIHADGATYITNMYVDDMGVDPGNSGTSV